MFTLNFNFAELQAYSEQIGGALNQMPFVLSQMLNDGAFKTRQVLVEVTWPKAVTVRNTAFASASLHVDKATKGNLRVEIFDRLARPSGTRTILHMHATGGHKGPHGKHLTVPVGGWFSRTSRGAMSKPDTARSIIDSTPKRALRVTDRGIFVGEGGRLHMRYSLARDVTQPVDVPFYRDFEYTMQAQMRTGFTDAMHAAMAPRPAQKDRVKT